MSQQITTISLEAIQYMCGLIRDLASVSEAIDNTNLADDKVFSNLYTKKLIDKCLEDANTESQKLVGALTHLTCEETTVQPTLDNSSINVIYLYSATGNAPYQQYLKISDTKLIDLGSTSVSLSAYLTATEIARDYVTKLDFDALKTEVEGKVDKTSILTTIDNLATDDQVYSAKATYDLANTKANTNHTHTASDITDLSIPSKTSELENDSNYLSTEDITNTINSTSTETEIPTAKAVYDELQEVFQSVSNGKNLIASAITDKGVDTLADATFKQMADNIGMISGGNVNEHVEKIKVSTMPVMSSYTSDNGEVIFSSEQSSSYKAYYVFNANSSNFWMSASNKTTDEWIGVKYTTPQIITEISILNASYRNVSASAIKNYRVEASNDGVDYDVLYVGENTNNTELSEWSITFGNDKEYLYYRLYVIDGFETSGVRIGKMSLKKDVIVSSSVKGTPLIPKMTSNTTPSGIASASSSYSSYTPYKAFGKNYPSSSDMWMPNVSDFSPWIQYEFDAPQIVKKVGVYQSVITDTKAHALKTYELLGSNDGTTFDSLGYGGVLQAELGDYKLNIFNNTKSYKIYRIRIIDVYNRTKQVYLGDIQLYG